MPPREGIADTTAKNARVLVLVRQELIRQDLSSRSQEVFPAPSRAAFER